MTISYYVAVFALLLIVTLILPGPRVALRYAAPATTIMGVLQREANATEKKNDQYCLRHQCFPDLTPSANKAPRRRHMPWIAYGRSHLDPLILHGG